MIKNNTLRYFVISALLLSSLIVVQNHVSAAVLPDLGTAINFGVLADTTITNIGNTVINGDLGLHSGTAITGFLGTDEDDGPGVVNGDIEQTTAVAEQAQADAETAFNALGGPTDTDCDNTVPWPTSGNREIGGLTLTPGVYCSDTSISIAGGTTLTLDGDGLYIFRAGSTLTTVTDADVVLANGASAENIFWKVGSSAALAGPSGGNTSFQGTIIALTDIDQSGAAGLDIDGRLLALGGQITFASATTVTVPVDDTVPTLVITSDPTSPSDSTSALEFTFEFSEDVTGFTIDDITLDFAGTGAGSVDGSIFATIDVNTYTLTLANQDLTDLQALTSGQTVVASVDMTGLDSVATSNPGSGTESFTWTFEDIIAPPPPSNDNNGGSSKEWATKPTFGVSYQTNEQFVTDGFGYSVFAKTITDNFHTGFAMADIPTDTSYPLYAKGYFANQLKIQEFCFGIPETGKGYLAESCIEVHFDSGYGSDRKITDVKVVHNSNAIDNISVQHEMASCNATDTVKVCDKTMITIAFAEPLQHSVMMIKGIDWKGKSTETYLNEGFNIDGKQLTDLPTIMIPSPTKYEGLIKVTQSEKYSNIWISDDDRVFERNSFGSFHQINQTHERYQDTGSMKTRTHSAFSEWKDYQAIKAKNIWDASKYVSTLPPSFMHDYPAEDSRTKFLKEHNMLEFARGQ